ncbi:TfoX/Sxy family protein [Nocardioides korecus]
MAYDEVLAERVRALLPGQVREGEEPGERRMFGGLAFLVGGRMAVAVSGQGGLMVRAEPGTAEELLARDGVARVEMRDRPVRGWVLVAPDLLTTDAGLHQWVGVGLDAVRALG